MKTLLFVFLTSLSFLCSGQYRPSTYRRTTVEVAQRLGYPAFIVGLRNKVETFLNEREAFMKLEVQDLFRADLNYRGYNLADRYRDNYDDLVDRFDRKFERISRKLLSAADELDMENAPEKEKALFIQNLQQEAAQSIDNLLQTYGAIIPSPSKKRRIT